MKSESPVDYKKSAIDLLQTICPVGGETMKIVGEMKIGN
jgi:hypothetical protein